MTPASDPIVRHWRDILLWPLQIEPGFSRDTVAVVRSVLTGEGGKPSPWRAVIDEFTADPAQFQERHYKEFVTFLPFVQRFLYGESRSARKLRFDPPAPPSVEVFRRSDVAALRITLQAETEPVTLKVAHVDLYFFIDLDVAMLNVEVVGENLHLSSTLDILHRFGRAYPTGWDAGGQGMHNVYKAEWLDAQGRVLAASDSENRGKFLRHVCAHRAPGVVAHWDYLLKPLILDHTDDPGVLRYRLIEYYRMPFMAFLAVDNPLALTPVDFMRIGLVSHRRPGDVVGVPETVVAEFEAAHCEDRYWHASHSGPHTRFLCNGHSIVSVGEAGSQFFMDANHGQLGQFRHQIFLAFLIAHFHRAALLSFSDQLSDATNDLDVSSRPSVRRFRRRIRAATETFLRFTHRYWFHEVSEHQLVQSLFSRTTRHLRNDAMFADVREEIRDMSNYLEVDAQRRQSGTVMRLTVVTTFGLIGTFATGLLGMNLIAAADAPLATRLGLFFWVTVGAALLILFAVAKSQRLADLLETLADERQSWRSRLKTMVTIVARRPE